MSDKPCPDCTSSRVLTLLIGLLGGFVGGWAFWEFLRMLKI